MSLDLISDTHARVARASAHYTTPFERELAIANLKWMCVHAPSHVQQMDCRMLLLAMRNLQSFGRPLSPASIGAIDALPASPTRGQAGDLSLEVR